jgi:hypothetical protein
MLPSPPHQNQTEENNDDDAADVIFADGEQEAMIVGNAEAVVRHRLYSHGGRFWHVPEGFQFPLGVRLDTGWKLWLSGLPANEIVGADNIRVQAPVRPFRLLKPTMLPPSIRSKYRLQWLPIFSLMEGAPGLLIEPRTIDTDALAASFSVAKAHLKTRVSYAFVESTRAARATPEQWEVSTWSKKVARSSIMKHGSVADIAWLPAVASAYNKPRQARGPRRRPLADLRRTRRRLVRAPTVAETDREEEEDDEQQEPAPAPIGGVVVEPAPAPIGGVVVGLPAVARLAEAEEEKEEPPSPTGGVGLPIVLLSEAARIRGEEVEREVREEMAEELHQLALRQRQSHFTI